MLSSLSTAALTERALVILLIACCGDMSVKGKNPSQHLLRFFCPVSLLCFALAGPTIAFHLAH